MKRMSFQLSVKALLVAFCMVGGFVAVTETSAQSGTLSGNSVATTINFVDADQATIILTNEVAVFDQQLGNFVIGSPSYNYAFRRIAYFKAIVHDLNAGLTVNTSLHNSLGSAISRELVFPSTKAELSDLYNETVVLLTL